MEAGGRGWFDKEHQCLHGFTVSLHILFISFKAEINNYIVRKPDNPLTSDQKTSPKSVGKASCASRYNTLEKTQHHFCGILARKALPKSNMRKYQTIQNSGIFYEITCRYSFKYHCHWLENSSRDMTTSCNVWPRLVLH